MSSNTHKSAAVPFINQKGERSMKRVKVERYVAGKKPAYAKEDEEEEEYYTEEEEEDDNEDQEDEDEDEDEETDRAFRSGRNLDYSRDEDDSSSSNESEVRPDRLSQDHESPKQVVKRDETNAEDDDDDDPRFRKLKQIESKAGSSQLIDVHRTQQIQPKRDLQNVILDQDDDEEEIRRRHLIARSRQVDIPLARQIENKQEENDDESEDETLKPPKRLETDDLLRDLKLTGISRTVREKAKTADEEAAEEQRLKEMIEAARREASFTKQIHEKVDEDIKKEIEKEALAKGDIGAREMTSVNTDDEDDELAYEQWRLRELQRVLRDRSERRLGNSVR